MILYSKTTEKQILLLSLLRLAIGWHFLYEGLVKLLTPGWSSSSFLELSRWIFEPVFKWITTTPFVQQIVDLLNIWGLILIGLALMIGVFTRIACVTGAILLALYYVANPPFTGMEFGVPTEGSYLIVNKNLIELLALLVLALYPKGYFFGIDRILARRNKGHQTSKPTVPKQETVTDPPADLNRRDMILSFATLPFLGAFAVSLLHKKAWKSQEEKHLVDAVATASVRSFSYSNLKDLKGSLPHAKIAGVDFSRMILGGNLIGGWAHARDLIYVSKLVKAYHHRDKIFETLLRDQCLADQSHTHGCHTGILATKYRSNQIYI